MLGKVSGLCIDDGVSVYFSGFLIYIYIYIFIYIGIHVLKYLSYDIRI